MISEKAKEAINRLAIEVAKIESEIGKGDINTRALAFNEVATRGIFKKTGQGESEALAAMLRSSAIAVVAAALLIERNSET